MRPTHESASIRPVIALLTDFGSADHYSGVVKGVIASICPRARIVDLSHEVTPFRILEASYLLWASYRFFPKRSVFACIVDPGVGTGRRILLARTALSTFLVPDNGLLDMVRAEAEIDECYEVRTKDSPFILSPVSATFQGRDVFAPVAAYLANGVAPAEFGSPCTLPRIRSPFVSSPGEQSALVLHCDRFGNIVTNMRNGLLEFIKEIKIKKAVIDKKIRFYGEGTKDTLSLIRGSSGLVEIVIREGSASRDLGIGPEEEIKIVWR